ncbi:MAG: DUF1559 domain-containing protein [Planctomycetia bacterium]|nr:DUF1559 domain-containing protein [Planctomycetia bacterium]
MFRGLLKRHGGRAAVMLLIGLLFGGAVGAGTVYLLKRGKAGIPGGPRLGPAEELNMVPADASGFVHIRLRDMWLTEDFAEFRKIVEKAGPEALKTLDESFVPAPSSIDRMTVVFIKLPPPPPPPPPPQAKKGGKGGKGGQPKVQPLPPPPPPPPADNFLNAPFPLPTGDTGAVVILTFKTPFDASAIRSSHLKAAVAKKVADKEYWEDANAGVAAYFPSDTVLVLGTGPSVSQFLTKMGKKEGPLASAIQQAAEGGRHIVAALNMGVLEFTPKDFETQSEEFKPVLKDLQTVLKAEAMSIGFSLGEESKFDIRAKYKDEAAAEAGEKALRGMAAFARKKLTESSAGSPSPKEMMEKMLKGKEGQPKPRPFKDLPEAIMGLVGLGSINSLDEWLADPPLRREGSEVILTPKVPSVSSLYATTAAASLALLLPATQKVRESAARMQDSNNLKQLALAMHFHHDATGTLPQPAWLQPQGAPNKPGGLSWRVHLLPYIEQQALYKQFKLDEPWDSENNKKLIEQMPKIYASPLVTDPVGQTRYKVFVGNGAAFERDKKFSLAQFADGTSNTIMIIGGGAPVIWTKPDDIEFTDDITPAILALPGQMGCNVAMGDGSVRWLALGNLSPQTLKAAVTRNGGEVFNLDVPGPVPFPGPGGKFPFPEAPMPKEKGDGKGGGKKGIVPPVID